jgi:hypothetical protein
MRYDKSQHAFLFKKYVELKSVILVQRAWRTEFKNERVPCRDIILGTASRFERTGSVSFKSRRQAKPSEKREAARKLVKTLNSDNDELSIRKLAKITGVSYSLVRSILKEDLHLKPYKQHEWHELEPGDYQKRLKFADFFLGLPKNARLLLLCCDEAWFYLHHKVNKQNDRRWLPSKPTDKSERPLHDEKVLIWCAISCDEVYGPYFFEGSVNQHKYLHMLKHFFWKGHCRARNHQKYYFLQDGATPHTARIVQKYLGQKFGPRFFTKDKWPPRSCDLNPCDFFLWGYLQDRVYKPMPQSLDELKANITREFKKIPKEILKSVFENFLKRMDLVKEKNGGHIEEK